MLFSSITFLYCFLPCVLLVYFVVPDRMKNLALLLASLFFYGWGEPKYLVFMFAAVAQSYIAALLAERFRGTKIAKLALAVSAVASLGLLAYCKYADFFIGNFNAVTGLSIPLLKVALPVGISFYTFQILSYVIDVYRGDVPAQRNFVDLAMYVAMFPQLIAGPIVRYSDIAGSLKNRKTTLADASEGITRFSVGLAKKILLANSAALIVSEFKAYGEKTVLFYWLYAAAYMLHIYFDFSGYSDMAIGLGRIFGFRFSENFNYPYISASITEFWRRWHISLGGWFRDYLYIPLGGNRKGRARQLFNILIVWMLTGIWHGAGNTFLIWGLLHGLASVAVRFCQSRWHTERLPKLLRWALTFAFLNVTWVFFRAGSVSEARTLLNHLVQGNFGPPPDGLLAGFSLVEINAFCDLFRYSRPGIWPVTLGFFGLTLFSVAVLPNTREMTEQFRPTFGRLLFSAVVLVWSLFSLSGVSSFLYFNF